MNPKKIEIKLRDIQYTNLFLYNKHLNSEKNRLTFRKKSDKL
ncbi:hypothetical protein CHCC14566_1456 [Bacillus licheniformis]|nr:hypothetical protein CHCC14566_1456 [Bacillus licheniformis]